MNEELHLNWKQKNRERYNEYQKVHSLKYWQANKDEILAKKKSYYQANREKIIAKNKEAYYKKKAAAETLGNSIENN